MNRHERRKVARLIKSGKVSSAPPEAAKDVQRPENAPTAEEREAAIKQVQLYADESCLKCQGSGILTINKQTAACSCALHGAVNAAAKGRKS